jgi:hypothetical protein
VIQRHTAPKALTALVALALATQVSCRPSGTLAVVEGSAARVERVSVDERPALVLLEREGDPEPAVALAFVHDFGSQASAALATLFAARLAKRGFPGILTDAHGLGGSVSTLVADAEEAARFFREATGAMDRPVRPGDPALGGVNRQLRALRSRSWLGAAEQNVAQCSGEFGVQPGAPIADFRSPSGAATLERWRSHVASTRTVRFAAVGPRAVLERAADAVRDLPAWPEGSKPDDPWPGADYVGVDLNPMSVKSLAIALRVGDAERVLNAAHELALPNSALRVRLAAQARAWKLTRVAATTRPRGACLRLDLTGPLADDPGWTEAARLTTVGLDEMRNALAATPAPRSHGDESLIRPADPRRAACAAAWRGLANQQPPGPERRAVAFATRFVGTSAEAATQLDAALRREAQTQPGPKLALRARVEAGQAEVWVLLASPCVAAAAAPTTAATPALFVTAAALLQPRSGPVIVEPWVSPLGVGLVAHGPREFPGEAPELHARRIASALGRLLLRASDIDTGAFLTARSELLHEVGSTPRPGWWLTLSSLTHGHVGWLDPRGGWEALRDATLEGAREQWLRFLSGPLRLAVLTNSDVNQGRVLRTTLEHWLRPSLAANWTCPAPPAGSAPRGEQRLRGRIALDSQPAAYIAVRVPAGQFEQARWTAWLLNRPGGWLERALEQPAFVSSASAQVVGRPEFAALVIEARALDGRLDQAVAQLRALMDRLASGAATQADFASARVAFAAARSNMALEPRNRLAQLWAGPEPRSVPSLRALKAFHAALRPDRLTVVVVDPGE